MSIKTKFAAVAIAIATVATGLAASSGEAHAKKWRGGAGIGLGIAAGALIGAGIAGAYAPHYGPRYVAYDHRRCRWVARYNSWGHYVGRTRVCNYPVY